MNFDIIKDYVKDSYALDTGRGCMRYVTENKTKEEFFALENILADAGATPLQKREKGENLFATYRYEGGNVIMSYFNYNHTICIVTDPLEGRKEPTLAAAAYEKLTEPQVTFLDLRCPDAVKAGNGMGFVYTLSDGSYVIYDGGYHGDGDTLVEFLEENNVRNEKPRVAAWILTHSHGDHYFAMQHVAANLADRITVEEFVMNVRHTVYEHEQYEPYLNEHFEGSALPKFCGASLVIPHTGQLLCYRDCEIEILSTQEEILPSHFRWLNETSIISRVFLGGQSIFMPADSELGIEIMIPTMYGDVLKSDMIQQAHHAFSGGSYTLYDLVRPRVAFWTCSEETWNKYCHHSYNNGYNYYLKNMVKENYHLGRGNITLTLPYKV